MKKDEAFTTEIVKGVTSKYLFEIAIFQKLFIIFKKLYLIKR